jgi:hypothetical protein
MNGEGGQSLYRGVKQAKQSYRFDIKSTESDRWREHSAYGSLLDADEVSDLLKELVEEAIEQGWDGFTAFGWLARKLDIELCR